MSNRPQPRLLQAAFIAGAALWLLSHPRRPKRALLWSALLLAADLLAVPVILRSKPAISKAELDSLEPERIPAIDQSALELETSSREAIRRSSDNMLRLLVVAPAVLLADRRLRERSPDWLAAYAWGHALTYTIYTFSPLGPAFADKYRPVVYRPEVPLQERMRGNNRNSQYSGHTGNAAFAAAFLANMLLARYGANAMRRFVMYGLAGAGGLLVGSLRVRAQKHFPTDIGAATLIGALMATYSAAQSGARR